MEKLELKDLIVDHDYYCSDSNFYSNDTRIEFLTFADFYEEWHDADVDMNLIFRWDIRQREESKRCFLELFMIHQRKGIFRPIMINYFDEKDVELFIQFITPHKEKLKSIWEPFNF